MGYTHSWGTNAALAPHVARSQKVPPLGDAVLNKVRAIVGLHRDALHADENRIIITPTHIQLIPCDDDEHGNRVGTPFVWRHTPGGIHGDSCTTESGSTYDKLVCLLLIVLRQTYPGLFCFSSNGSADCEWIGTLSVANTLGINIDESTLRAYLTEEANMLTWWTPPPPLPPLPCDN